MKIMKYLSKWKSVCISMGIIMTASSHVVASSAAVTKLNVAVVYSQGFKSTIEGANPTAYANGLIMMANSQYSNSQIGLELNAAIVAPLKGGHEVDIAGSDNTILQALKDHFIDLADWQKADHFVDAQIHQVVLLLPKSTSQTSPCGVAVTPSNGEVAMFSIVHAECRDNLGLAHELAHNLTASHSQSVSSTWGTLENPKAWTSVMVSGGNNRQYFTNPDIYDPAVCGIKFNQGFCGNTTHNNSGSITNYLPTAVAAFCDITIGESSCTSTPALNLEMGWARYEYGNCIGTSRSGTVEWQSVSDATSYEAQFLSGTQWYALYSGSSTVSVFNTSATSKTHSFRVRAKAGSNSGTWKSFSGFVPSCRGSGGANLN